MEIMTAIERAQKKKRQSDMKIEGLSKEIRKWFDSIDKLDIHHNTYPPFEKISLIKDIYGNGTIGAFIFIFKWGYMAWQSNAKRKAKGAEA